MKKFAIIVLLAFPMMLFSSPIRSNLGDANAEFAEGELENPYITDGLIAHWDGIWNAGIGLHDSNVAVWKDLAGVQGNMPIPQTLSVGDDSLYTVSRKVIDMKNLVSPALADAINSSTITVEFVGQMFCEDNYNDPIMSVFKNSSCRPLTVLGVSADAGRWRRCRASLRAIDGTFIGSSSAVWKKDGGRASLSIVWDGESMTQFVNGAYNWTGSAVQHESADATTGMYLRLLALPTAQNGSDMEVCRISIYSRALTDDEILHNHEIDKERFGLQ